jgi:glycosyltransferase involved in cell wall biosynthesis
VFVDFSVWQAMGLTALEAMCTGCATIVPAAGGAASFARHGVNCLVIDTSAPQACLAALGRLVEDSRLRTSLERQAIADAAGIYPERTALGILATLFDK